MKVNEKLFVRQFLKEVTTSKPKMKESWNDTSSEQRDLVTIAQTKTVE